MFCESTKYHKNLQIFKRILGKGRCGKNWDFVTPKPFVKEKGCFVNEKRCFKKKRENGEGTLMLII